MYWPSRVHLFGGLCFLSAFVLLWNVCIPKYDVKPQHGSLPKALRLTTTHNLTSRDLTSSTRQGTHAARLLSSSSSPRLRSEPRVAIHRITSTASIVKYELRVNNVNVTYTFNSGHVTFSNEHRVYGNLSEALRSRGSGTVILAVVDLGYLDLAINLYLRSILSHRLHNFLFICAEKTACDVLNALNIPAYLFINYQDIGQLPSSYFSQQFKKKTHVKTQVILQSLLLGYNVLITDVDIVFLQNPLEHFPCAACDIQISSDEVEGNSGFYLAANSSAAILLHERALKVSHEHPELSNQKALSRVMLEMKGRIRSIVLSNEVFPNGVNYYEQGHRMWAAPCAKCVIVHNNWIVTSSAKIYRFKEHSQWLVDRNGYYSSQHAKYLIYSIPGQFAAVDVMEFNALQSAFWLAHLLNRTLILPEFTRPVPCKYAACSGHRTVTFNTRYYVAALDEQLGDMYREHTFLRHPDVPDKYRDHPGPLCVIHSAATTNPRHPPDAHVYHPKGQGATSAEVVRWFGRSRAPVLRFHHLYNAVDLAALSHEDVMFALRLQRGLRSSDYRQYYNRSVSASWLPARTGSGSFMFLIVVPIFVVPCLCIAICAKTGLFDMQEELQKPSSSRKYERIPKR